MKTPSVTTPTQSMTNPVSLCSDAKRLVSDVAKDIQNAVSFTCEEDSDEVVRKTTSSFYDRLKDSEKKILVHQFELLPEHLQNAIRPQEGEQIKLSNTHLNAKNMQSSPKSQALTKPLYIFIGEQHDDFSNVSLVDQLFKSCKKKGLDVAFYPEDDSQIEKMGRGEVNTRNKNLPNDWKVVASAVYNNPAHNKKMHLVGNREKTVGDCKARHTPCSTFKIAISLMGYDSNILTNETNPELPFKAGYVDYYEMWKQPHNPTTWMKYSVVWYSQIITQKLGEKKFSSYIKKFNYGNQNVSGDEGKNNGLTESWLGSSLQISPEEQVQFLQKLLDDKLTLSAKAHEMTRNILFTEELPDDWKLYGKTGSCDSSNKHKQTGWFVGFLQKEKRQIIFANYLEDEERLDYSGGKLAKEQVRKKLMELTKTKN